MLLDYGYWAHKQSLLAHPPNEIVRLSNLNQLYAFGRFEQGSIHEFLDFKQSVESQEFKVKHLFWQNDVDQTLPYETGFKDKTWNVSKIIFNPLLTSNFILFSTFNQMKSSTAISNNIYKKPNANPSVTASMAASTHASAHATNGIESFRIRPIANNYLQGLGRWLHFSKEQRQASTKSSALMSAIPDVPVTKTCARTT